MHANGFAVSAKEKKSRRFLLLKRSVPLYLLILPSLILLIVFTYIPMYGVTIAFKDYKTGLGIFGSEWVGFKNFTTFFNSYQFWPILRNTLVISIYSIVVMFPLPILVALICSQITSSRYKKFFQVTTYLPHFISTVVMCGMIMLFLSPSSGIIAKLLSFGRHRYAEPDGLRLRVPAHLRLDRSMAAYRVGQYPVYRRAVVHRPHAL